MVVTTHTWLPVVMVTYGSGGPVNTDDWDKEVHQDTGMDWVGHTYDSIPRYSNMTGKVKEGAIKGRFLDKLWVTCLCDKY